MFFLVNLVFSAEEFIFHLFFNGNIWVDYFFNFTHFLTLTFSVFVICLYSLIDVVELSGIAYNELVNDVWIRECKEKIKRYKNR
jgi:hypothetical protein